MPSSGTLGFVPASEAQRKVATAPPGPAMTLAMPMEEPREVSTIEVPRTLLTRWNMAMSLFHTSLAVVALTVGNVDLSVPIYKTDLTFRTSNRTGFELIPSYVEAGSLPFTILVAVFFGLSATAHGLNATLLNRYYLSRIEQCWAPTRWWEYTFSAAVMFAIISYTLGVRERMLLAAGAGLIATTMPFGYWAESHGRPLSADEWCAPLWWRLLPWAIGHMPQLVAWAIVLVEYFDEGGERAPDFVTVLLFAQLALFFSFGFVSFGQQLSTPRNYWRGELAYQVLSLGAKGLLGGILLANVLFLSRFDELFE